MQIHTLYKKMVSLPCVFGHVSLNQNSVKMMIHTLHKNKFSVLCVFAHVFLNRNSGQMLIHIPDKKMIFLLYSVSFVFLFLTPVKMLIQIIQQRNVPFQCSFFACSNRIRYLLHILAYKLWKNSLSGKKKEKKKIFLNSILNRYLIAKIYQKKNHHVFNVL